MDDGENDLVKQTATDERVSSPTQRTPGRPFAPQDKLPPRSLTPPGAALFTFKRLRKNIGGFIANIFTW